MVAFRAGSGIKEDNSAAFTIPLPPGTQENDFLLAVLAMHGENNTWATLPGWTRVYPWDGGTISTACYWKLAGYDEIDPTFNNGTAGQGVGLIVGFSAVDTGSPIEDSADNTAWGSDHSSPSVISGGADRGLIAVCIPHGAVVNSFPAGYLEGYTQLHDWGSPPNAYAYYRLGVGAGATGTADWVIASNRWAHSLHFCLAPVSAGPSVSIGALRMANQEVL